MDNTQLPGILPTVSYLAWPPEMAETVADMLVRKLGREPYVPFASLSPLPLRPLPLLSLQ